MASCCEDLLHHLAVLGFRAAPPFEVSALHPGPVALCLALLASLNVPMTSHVRQDNAANRKTRNTTMIEIHGKASALVATRSRRFMPARALRQATASGSLLLTPSRHSMRPDQSSLGIGYSRCSERKAS